MIKNSNIYKVITFIITLVIFSLCLVDLKEVSNTDGLKLIFGENYNLAIICYVVIFCFSLASLVLSILKFRYDQNGTSKFCVYSTSAILILEFLSLLSQTITECIVLEEFSGAEIAILALGFIGVVFQLCFTIFKSINLKNYNILGVIIKLFFFVTIILFAIYSRGSLLTIRTYVIFLFIPLLANILIEELRY